MVLKKNPEIINIMKNIYIYTKIAGCYYNLNLLFFKLDSKTNRIFQIVNACKKIIIRLNSISFY